MSVRPLSNDELDCAESLRALGMITRVEWMAALKVDKATVVSLRTDHRPGSTDPDAAMQDEWDAGGSLIIHHNHPSDESLSCADWRTLLDFPVSEIFAHTTDGSIFYGALVDRDSATVALSQFDEAGNAAEAVIIAASPPPSEALLGLSNLLRKHAVALALAGKGCVVYEHRSGLIWANILGRHARLVAAAVHAAQAKL